MDKIDLLESAKKFIGEDSLQEAIDMLISDDSASHFDPRFKDEIILLKSRFNSLKKDRRNHLLTPDEETTRENRLKKDFLDLIDKEKDQLALHPETDPIGQGVSGTSLLPASATEFVGRKFVFSAINTFMDQQKQGFFILKGDPGAGKSAFLAEYVARNPCLFHFNLRAQSITSTRQCLENILSQARTSFSLPKIDLPTNPADYGICWNELMRALYHAKAPGQKIVIVIDALDEADRSTQNSHENILALPSFLLEGIFFVLSSRRISDSPIRPLSPIRELDLQDYPVENDHDLKLYINQPEFVRMIQDGCAREGIELQVFIDKLVEKSEQNFMYLRYVLPEIQNGIYRDKGLESLPAGLSGYYKDHWKRMGMDQRPLSEDKIRVLYVIAQYGEPVSQNMIAKITGISSLPITFVLENWKEFLHITKNGGKTMYSIYHSSFLDFLRDHEVLKAAGEELGTIDQLIGDYFMNEWKSGTHE